jgi:hypothetical protein
MPFKEGENQELSVSEVDDWVVISKTSPESDLSKFDFNSSADTTPVPFNASTEEPIKLSKITETSHTLFSHSATRRAAVGIWKTSSINKIDAAGLGDVLSNPYGTGRFYQNYSSLKSHLRSYAVDDQSTSTSSFRKI